MIHGKTLFVGCLLVSLLVSGGARGQVDQLLKKVQQKQLEDLKKVMARDRLHTEAENQARTQLHALTQKLDEQPVAPDALAVAWEKLAREHPDTVSSRVALQMARVARGETVATNVSPRLLGLFGLSTIQRFGQYRAVAFAHETPRLAVGEHDGTIHLWDCTPAGPRAAGKLVGHTKAITCLQFAADDSTLVSGARDDTLRLWEMRLDPPECRRVVPVEANAYLGAAATFPQVTGAVAVAYVPSSFFTFKNKDKNAIRIPNAYALKILVWDFTREPAGFVVTELANRAESPVLSPEPWVTPDGAIALVCWRPKGEKIFRSEFCNVTTSNVQRKSQILGEKLSAVALAPTGDRWASFGIYQFIDLLPTPFAPTRKSANNSNSSALIASLPIPRERKAISLARPILLSTVCDEVLAFDARAQTLACAFAEGQLLAWDTGKIGQWAHDGVRAFTPVAWNWLVPNGINKMSFSADGTYLAIVSKHGLVHLLHVASPNKLPR